MTVRARLICQSVDENNYGSTDKSIPVEKYGELIRMSAVYSTDLQSPNYSYSQATPYADLIMSITNPAVFGFFVPGRTYDLTFEPTPEEPEITNPDPLPVD